MSEEMNEEDSQHESESPQDSNEQADVAHEDAVDEVFETRD